MALAVSHVLSLIIFLSVRASESKRLLSLKDTVASRFRPVYFDGTWISDSELSYIEDDIIMLLDVTTQNHSQLADASLLKRYNATSYFMSADRDWVAVSYDKEQGFRHSASSRYAVHELKNGFHFEVAGGKRLQLMMWSPVGHSLVYVLDNDLYYQHKPGPLAGDRLTNNGLVGVYYNGVADWVYEEEVLQTSKALWFSPEGTKLAFASFDDSNVPEVNYPKYGDPGDLKWQYVKDITLRYPKAGAPNPVVTLNVIDLRLKRRMKIERIPAPVSDVTDDNILADVVWIDDKFLAASWTNRVQTIAVTLVCDVATSECQKVLETKKSDGWVDYPKLFFKNLTHFATLLPQPQGDSGNFNHITTVSNRVQTPITSGKRVVTQILKWNHSKSLIYYLATEESNPARIHLYVIKDDGSEPEKCLSCEVCGTVSVRISKAMSYYVLGCMGPEVPSYSVYSSDGAHIMQLANNSHLQNMLEDVALPKITNLEVDIGGGLTARVRLLTPPAMNRGKQYPLLLSVYGGPDSIKITDVFTPPNFESYLTTRLEVVVAYVDARGSARRGDKYKYAVYRNLGGPEIEDFINVTKDLHQRFLFIDPKRTAIWGWSYGGYATAMTLAKDQEDVFKCGISVAPVTSWIYYDSIYTERYMGLPTPEDNEVGYNNSDVTRRYENFRKKQFFLIHGNGDDNVHFQQSMALARTLETHDVLFMQQSYPDEAHGLSRVRMHLYHTMEKFWANCFEVNSTTT